MSGKSGQSPVSGCGFNLLLIIMSPKKLVYAAFGTLAAIAMVVAVVIAAGFYNVAADDRHTPLVNSFLTTVREQSIARRAAAIKVPDLHSAEMIRQGAAQYAQMCAGCHLAPGYEGMDLRPGLNPQAPDLAKLGATDPARNFWIIKHGIKMTGMPAWGVNHDDETLWSIVAFLNKLPGMSEQQYAALVKEAGSGGHAHAGAPHHHSQATGQPAHGKPAKVQPHAHGKNNHHD